MERRSEVRERVPEARKDEAEAGQAAVRSPASLSARLSAQVFDTAIAALIIVLGLAGTTRTSGAPALIAFALSLAYLLLADSLPGGQSLGKRLMGIAVVDERTGRPCTLVQALVRNGLLLFLSIIDWLCVFSRTRQRLGDKAAHTIVVKV